MNTNSAITFCLIALRGRHANDDDSGFDDPPGKFTFLENLIYVKGKICKSHTKLLNEIVQVVMELGWGPFFCEHHNPTGS